MDENLVYLESYEFTECQKVYADDNGNGIFAGSICSNNGSEIKIVSFSNEYCSQVKKNTEIKDFLDNGHKFDDDILEKIFDVYSCVSYTSKEYIFLMIMVNINIKRRLK